MLVNNWQLYDNFGAIDMGWSFIFFTKFNKTPSLQIVPANQLQSKNIDTKGMVSFFRKMDAGLGNKKDGAKEQSTEKSSEVASWFSSHPDTLIRIQAIEEFIATHPCNTCMTLTWDKSALLAELDNVDKK